MKLIFDKLRNGYYRVKNKLSVFLENPQFVFTLPLILAFVGICVRILSFIFDNPQLRILIWGFGFILIFLFWSIRDNVLAKCLNAKSIQTFVFLFLRLEDIVYSYKGSKGSFFAFCVGFTIVHAPAIIFFVCFGTNFFVWYWFILLVIGIYIRLRNLFIFPDMHRLEILKSSAYMPLIDHPDKFNWNLVVKNADAVTTKLHGKSISNKLGPIVGNSPLTYVGIRYISSWKTGIETLAKVGGDFVELAKQHPRTVAFGFLGVSGSAVGIGGVYAYLENRKLDLESERIGLESERIGLESQMLDNEARKLMMEHLRDMRNQHRNSPLPPDHPLRVELAVNINAADSKMLGLANQNLLPANNSVLPFLQKGVLGMKLEQAENLNQPKVSPELLKGPTCVYEEPAIVVGILRKSLVLFQSLFL